MSETSSGIMEGLRLLFSGSEIYQIIGLSLFVSILATFFATIAGVPLGVLLALKNFRGKSVILLILNTLMGLPPVVLGLIIYLLFSHSGPLGRLDFLFTPKAMILAQAVLAFPIISALTFSAISSLEARVRFTALSLGASRFQMVMTLMQEARYVMIAAIMAGFGRAIAEFGASLIVGGNIKGFTRIMTTTIAMETGKGNFELAIALGVILLILSLIVNFAAFYLPHKIR